MDFKELLPMLSKLAPTVATALGGPLAGTAIKALGDVFGLDMSADTKENKEALVGALKGATQEQLMALKKADQEYEVKMAELGFKNVETIASLAASDRADARKRETNVKDNTPKILAYLITIGFFGIIAFMLFGKIPSENKDILYILLGSLGTAWTGCIAYYFGSTNGSMEKSKLLALSEPIKK